MIIPGFQSSYEIGVGTSTQTDTYVSKTDKVHLSNQEMRPEYIRNWEFKFYITVRTSNSKQTAERLYFLGKKKNRTTQANAT